MKKAPRRGQNHALLVIAYLSISSENLIRMEAKNESTPTCSIICPIIFLILQ